MSITLNRGGTVVAVDAVIRTTHAGSLPRPAALDDMWARYSRHGDVDAAELAATVEGACSRAAGPRVAVTDFPDWVHLAKDDASRAPRAEEPIQLDAMLAEVEAVQIVDKIGSGGRNAQATPRPASLRSRISGMIRSSSSPRCRRSRRTAVSSRTGFHRSACSRSAS